MTTVRSAVTGLLIAFVAAYVAAMVRPRARMPAA